MASNTKWWCVLDVDDDIPRYYRWWLARERHIFLQQPSWGGHVSIIRGESKVQHAPLGVWRKHEGIILPFEYQHGCIGTTVDKSGGMFYWIRARCPQMDEIRTELGLPVGWGYHITVGRTYY